MGAFDSSKGKQSKSPCGFYWGANTSRMYGGGYTDAATQKESVQEPEWVGKVSATQLECFSSAPECIAGRKTDEQVMELAAALAKSIAEFMTHFYGLEHARADQ